MKKALAVNEKYNGFYVALKDLEDDTVISSGKDPGEALDEARKNGCKNPLILYIPEKDTVNIY